MNFGKYSKSYIVINNFWNMADDWFGNDSLSHYGSIVSMSIPMSVSMSMSVTVIFAISFGRCSRHKSRENDAL